jgi:broad specificity phosphatase PhoE
VKEERDIATPVSRDQARSLPPVVFLCRHGETVLNASGSLRGLSDPDLDATGRQQARAEMNDKLLDRDYGPLNGHLVEEVNATWGSVDNAPGVESRESVLARAQSALAEGASRARHGPVVLVSHDAINSALLSFLDPERWPEPSVVPQPTGCLNILQRDGDIWAVVTAGLRPGDM